ncbi:MMPL family transporter [Phycicoccus flavus]|uniref:MMPL family transporter n=1 Tax=Phycicoccus flavus TaxID=2502783 RepID=UPI000FEC1C93|nr:MMPL family transporter [Phycicoccus flavus]NHA69628.1 MMPL family transporter [Phycicoccus flavus]
MIVPRPLGRLRPSGRRGEPKDAPAPDSWSRRYARVAMRLRWVVIVGWVGLLLLALYGPQPPSNGNDLASIIPQDSAAISAEIRSVDLFGYPLNSRTAVVQRDPRGLSVFVEAESVLDALAVNQSPQDPPLLGALPLTNAIPLGGPMGERNTTVLTNLFMDPRSSFVSQQRSAEQYVTLNLGRPDDHVVGITGSVPARAEQARIVAESLHTLEILTVLAIVGLVTVAFRSVVAPVLALGAAGLAYVITLDLSTVVEGFLGVAAPTELQPLLVALLLGVVTDYTIFYVTALRAQLSRTDDVDEAVELAIATYTPIVTVAGITVAAGTGALLAARSEFFASLGPAMTLAIVVGLLVSVTLVPALIAVLGPRVFWPGRLVPRKVLAFMGLRQFRRELAGSSRLMERLTERRTAAVVLAATVLVLVVASLPLASMRLGVGFTSSLPDDNPVKRATAAASAGFAPGISAPTTILIERPGLDRDLAALSAFQRDLADEPGVAAILGPAQNFTQRPLGVVLSNDGNAARMLVVLDRDPLGASAIGDLAALHDAVPGAAARAGLTGATVTFAGDTALAEGLVASTVGDLYRIAVVAVVVNLLLLVVFLRSLLAPVLLLGCSVLALAASLGLTTFVFDDPDLGNGITFYVPFAAAVLLVSLGSDYNIFGVGRVWDEAERMPMREAVIRAFPETSSAITTAGITLAVSFGMLAIIPLAPFRELGFVMVVGILIDAFVVRTLLVPCLLTLLGKTARWPAKGADDASTATTAPA